jgi:recombination protein RecT
MNDMTTTATSNPLVKFRAQLEQRAGELKMVLPSHITPEKFQRTILTAVQGDPDLLSADRQSLILACMRAAQDGLLPDKREAAIVVFNENKKVDGQWVKRKVATYLPMVYGLRKKILQSGEVAALEVGIVYRKELESNDFYYRVGVEPPLGHKPSFDLTMDNTTDDKIIAAYSIATMKDGAKSYEVMRQFEIDKVREASMTGATRTKRGDARQPSGPWVEWFPEQAKKTVMRRHSKVLPMSGDIIVDVEGRELEAGMSAAALLSAPAIGPTLIEDAGDRTDDQPAHDPETGELIDSETESLGSGEGEDTPDNQIATDDAAPAAAKAKRVAKTKADPVDERKQEQTPAESARATETEKEPETSTDTQTGLTKHPAEDAADALLLAMKGAATIIDLDRHWRDAESKGDLEAMPDEIYNIVLAEHEKHGTRLGRKVRAQQAEVDA